MARARVSICGWARLRSELNCVGWEGSSNDPAGFLRCRPGFAVLVVCMIDVLMDIMQLDLFAALSVLPVAWSVNSADRR